MFFQIYKYEVLYWFKKPATYLYFSIFFCFSFITFIGTGGFFDGPTKTNGAIRLLNSPYELSYMLQYLGKLFLFLIPAVIGTTIYNDFKHKVYPIIYSFPIDKKAYLSGKFLGAFTVTISIALSSGLAFLIGEWLLGSSNPRIGTFHLMGYLHPYFFLIIPNLFVFGIFVFGAVALSRNIYVGFILTLLFFLIQIMSGDLFPGNTFFNSLADPFGQSAITAATQFWTVQEKNTLPIPIQTVLIYNRLLWIGFSVLIGVLSFNVFSFSQRGIQLNLVTLKNKKRFQTEKETVKNNPVSNISFNFSLIQQLKTAWRLSKADFKYLVTHWMFYIFVFFEVLTISFMLLKVTQKGEMLMLPFTRIILFIPAFFFVSMIILITFIHSGMVVHRAKIANMDSLVNTTPVNNWVLMASKVMAIIQVQLLLLTVLLICGILLQFSNGFYSVEPGLYLFHLFIIIAPLLMGWAMVSVFVHSMIQNLYLGIFALLLLWLLKGGLEAIGITSRLIPFYLPPHYLYSDMNGYGNLPGEHFLVTGYWIIFTSILLLAAFLFWEREQTFVIKERWQLAAFRCKKRCGITYAILIALFFGLGHTIYRSEHSLVKVPSNAIIFKSFKDKFNKYQNTSQPRITSIKMAIDLYPENNAFHAEGESILTNKTAMPIDTLLIKTGFDEVTTYQINTPNKLLASDRSMKFYVHQLQEPLLPNDSISLKFKITNKKNNRFQRNSNVLHNGTFIKQDILPRLGYFAGNDKKHPADSTAKNNHYQAIDSDLIHFEAIISTSKEQVAIATGSLKAKWQKDGRNYYKYRTDKPIKMGMAFNSGIFQVKTSKWEEIPVDVYYHPTHPYDIENMIHGLKSALKYNSKYFGDYHRKEMKIIEFPLSEGSFATTFANAILISEVRFGVNAKSTEKVDLSFYVTAHEMTHQWFGNQVLPKDVLGAVMLTESITEYVTLKIYEHAFGKKRALQFLKLQRLRYLKGRTRETANEPPLYLVSPKQDYIAYGKGALAFNALAHYWGETEVNHLLKSFLKMYPYNARLYPTSLDFLKLLKHATPDSLHSLISDMFENTIRYDCKINRASIHKTSDRDYLLDVDFEVLKYNDKNPETPDAFNDLIEIAVYDRKDTLLQLRRVRVHQPFNKQTFRLTQKPKKIVIDPNVLLIDKNLKNNTFEF